MKEELEDVEDLSPLPDFQRAFDWSPDVDMPSVSMFEFYIQINNYGLLVSI